MDAQALNDGIVFRRRMSLAPNCIEKLGSVSFVVTLPHFPRDDQKLLHCVDCLSRWAHNGTDLRNDEGNSSTASECRQSCVPSFAGVTRVVEPTLFRNGQRSYHLNMEYQKQWLYVSKLMRNKFADRREWFESVPGAPLQLDGKRS
jgi:hypothetical protein